MESIQWQWSQEISGFQIPLTCFSQTNCSMLSHSSYNVDVIYWLTEDALHKVVVFEYLIRLPWQSFRWRIVKWSTRVSSIWETHPDEQCNHRRTRWKFLDALGAWSQPPSNSIFTHCWCWLHSIMTNLWCVFLNSTISLFEQAGELWSCVNGLPHQ